MKDALTSDFRKKTGITQKCYYAARLHHMKLYIIDYIMQSLNLEQ